ncbi:MAG: TlpA disulfide reductase family protein [Candidatus Omnitrophica bacterium]|nr:TlpA disulfide reductase family protein [Candidatus Omnitrophota bacterium]MDD5573749.1 TlpA disulfide reductase family protein [Candidatus Omnitrophota bacterium]
MKRRMFEGAVLLVFLMTLAFQGAFAAPPEDKPVPDFTLNSIGGQAISLSDYKGKKNVIVMFWKIKGLYCPFELNKLKRMYPELQKNGFEVLAVNRKEAIAKVAGYAAKEALPFPVLLDIEGDVSDMFDVSGIPVFLIIDQEGRIRWRGYRFPDRYRELVSSS